MIYEFVGWGFFFLLFFFFWIVVGMEESSPGGWVMSEFWSVGEGRGLVEYSDRVSVASLITSSIYREPGVGGKGIPCAWRGFARASYSPFLSTIKTFCRNPVVKFLQRISFSTHWYFFFGLLLVWNEKSSSLWFLKTKFLAWENKFERFKKV